MSGDPPIFLGLQCGSQHTIKSILQTVQGATAPKGCKKLEHMPGDYQVTVNRLFAAFSCNRRDIITLNIQTNNLLHVRIGAAGNNSGRPFMANVIPQPGK
jgi:hypothetical protein